jgi:hypothetical protein
MPSRPARGHRTNGHGPSHARRRGDLLSFGDVSCQTHPHFDYNCITQRIENGNFPKPGGGARSAAPARRSPPWGSAAHAGGAGRPDRAVVRNAYACAFRRAAPACTSHAYVTGRQQPSDAGDICKMYYSRAVNSAGPRAILWPSSGRTGTTTNVSEACATTSCRAASMNLSRRHQGNSASTMATPPA